MHAFHFGSSERRLFGAYHAPDGALSSNRAVLLCQPIGHEYIRAHRAMRNLAMSLAAAGFHVLRFDYYATGDSAGDTAEGTVAQWQSDIAAAVDELKDMSGATRVSLAGLRFGATLAAMAARARSDVDTLLLSDPVVHGREYVQEVFRLERAWRAARPYLAGNPAPPQPELLGFPASPALRQQLEAVDLLTLDRWPSKRVVLMRSAGTDTSELEAHLTGTAVRLERERVEAPCDWDRPQSVHLTLLASEINQRIVSCLRGSAAA